MTPTGKKITITYVGIHRIVNGKVAEKWSDYDMLDFYKELGVIKHKRFPKEQVYCIQRAKISIVLVCALFRLNGLNTLPMLRLSQKLRRKS